MTDAERFLEDFRAPWSLRRTRRLLLPGHGPTWKGARALVFTTEVDGGTARDWLPPALRPTAPARATVFVADYPETTFGVAYREAGVLLHGLLRGREALHCAWMLVDDDTALILGRELLGFPKKLGTISLAFEEGRASASVARRGATLLALSAALDAEGETGPAFPLPIVNVRGLPGLLPAALWRMDAPQRVLSGRRARILAEVHGADFDPLDRLGIGKREVEGGALVTDIGVPPERPGLLPRGVRPVGLVSPAWLAARYPFRVW